MTPQQAQQQQEKFFKHHLREGLMFSVYNAWDKRLQEGMDDLLIKNNNLNHTTEYCIRLRGVCHYLSSCKPMSADPDYYPANKLHPQLVPMANDWVAQYNEIETEKRVVSHSLSSILAVSSRLEDFQEMLPDGLQAPLEALIHLLPDPAEHKRAPADVVAAMKGKQASYLALMGQRYILSLIL